MAVSLLDVNVLMALAWPTNIRHDAAQGWFDANRLPVVKTAIGFDDVLEGLHRIVAAPEHRFWNLDVPFAGISSSILGRVAGHHQPADAMLLDLAIRKSGKLATFDRRVRAILGRGRILRLLR
jgi:predicted nucleic acid-binding protein